MGTTDANTKSPSKLRAEYGPAPWWDEDRLAELLHYEGLSYKEIADIWAVHPRTVGDRAREYGIGRQDR